MEAEAQSLWQKLSEFKFDEEGTTLTFAARLARENGWRLGYAQRVVDEYRRFLLLSMVAGHAISPSEAVDQAWHLHLTYTKSYWQKLCGEVLPRPLHHCPTLGGEVETEKFEDWYTKTLESYRTFFQEEPPADIWPPPGKQMESVVDSRWVNATEYFIIPRNPLKWFTMAILLVAPMLMTGGCAADAPAGLAPLDFNASSFLTFLALVGGFGFVVAIFIRFFYPMHDPLVPIDVESSSRKVYLSQGPQGLVLAVIAKLMEQGVLKMTEIPAGWLKGKTYQLTVAGPLPDDATSLDRLIYGLAPSSKPGELGKLVAKAIPLAREEGALLQEMGLLEPNPCEPFVRRWVPSLTMLAITGLCFAKLVVGFDRGKPVGILLVVGLASVVMAFLLFRRSFRTPKGEEVLKSLRTEHAKLSPVARSSDPLSADEVFLAAGIFGLSYLSYGEYNHLHEEVKRSQMNHGGCGAACGSNGCGGSGCGSSGCGSSCGGGGCGGCGGCGGS
ncbi:TIGR04222 domain-containing membrane protein [Bremerella cremea]|uniref:TIGR04222 domain-containing membrane protein n=1 Tax=Bremerella cremea TaxID=1031537 RepID=UPI0031E71AAF